MKNKIKPVDPLYLEGIALFLEFRIKINDRHPVNLQAGKPDVCIMYIYPPFDFLTICGDKEFKPIMTKN